MPIFTEEDIRSRFYEQGRLDAAREAFPDAPAPWLDLSTTISPWPYPAPNLFEEDWRRPPSAAALKELCISARRRYGVSPLADVIALPGASLGHSLLPWLFRSSRTVAIVGSTNPRLLAAWSAPGHTVSEIAELEAAGRAAIVIVTNPNNPDGQVAPLAQLADLLNSLLRKDGLLIVDETFADADPGHSILPHVNRLDRTVVLRSFGKFYGAEGVRLGFAVTSHPIAERLRQAIGANPVSAAAIAFGQAALNDEAWVSTQSAKLVAAAEKMDGILSEAGFRTLGGTRLFRFARPDGRRDWFQHLASQGVLVRLYPDNPGLRFGLPKDDEEFERLRTALNAGT